MVPVSPLTVKVISGMELLNENAETVLFDSMLKLSAPGVEVGLASGIGLGCVDGSGVGEGNCASKFRGHQLH